MATGTGHEEFSELAQYEIDERSVRLLRYEYCAQHDVVVLGVVRPGESGPVTVGMLEPDRADLAAEVAAVLKRPVRPVQLNAYEVRRALDVGYRRAETRQGYALTLRPTGEISFERDSPSAATLDELLGLAVHMGASDVHIETYEHDVDVRFRIDGVLRQIGTPLANDNVQAVVARLKVLAGLDIAERRRGQDGRVKAVFEERGPVAADRLPALRGPRPGQVRTPCCASSTARRPWSGSSGSAWERTCGRSSSA